MTHPLTDDHISEIFDHDVDLEDQMRLAYDRGRNEQLEQVIEWLRFIAKYGRYKLDFHNDTNSFLNDLRKVMRPTQEDNS